MCSFDTYGVPAHLHQLSSSPTVKHFTYKASEKKNANKHPNWRTLIYLVKLEATTEAVPLLLIKDLDGNENKNIKIDMNINIMT